MDCKFLGEVVKSHMLMSYRIVIISCIRLKYIVALLQAGQEADFTSKYLISFAITRCHTDQHTQNSSQHPGSGQSSSHQSASSAPAFLRCNPSYTFSSVDSSPRLHKIVVKKESSPLEAAAKSQQTDRKVLLRMDHFADFTTMTQLRNLFCGRRRITISIILWWSTRKVWPWMRFL